MLNHKGPLIAEGKTKKIFSVNYNPGLVIMESKDDITAHDDPKFTKIMADKAILSNSANARLNDILKEAGIGVAFMEQLSPKETLAQNCNMILIESVCRRYADGSILKRCPGYIKTDGTLHHFKELIWEPFLKTTGNKIVDRLGYPINTTPVEDPLIENPYDDEWKLRHPKKLYTGPDSNLGLTVRRTDILPGRIKIESMEGMSRRIFLILEAALVKARYRLIDLKVEFGITAKGKLLLADVIDNDSWRVRNLQGQDQSKQGFRDGQPLEVVKENYEKMDKVIKSLVVPYPNEMKKQ